MKTKIFLYLVLSCIIFTGCSSGLEEELSPNKETTINVDGISQKISKEDAVVIANRLLKKGMTRNNASDLPTFEYVLNENTTRSTTLPDTLAYVLNYPNEGGFVIVATDNRVYPVLAFSPEGEFSFENESVKENFIDRIGAYMETADPSITYSLETTGYPVAEVVGPFIKFKIGQRSPWDKYVIEEHPGCPVGCVAVATALVMSHSKKVFKYHNIEFKLKSIVESLYKGQYPETLGMPQRIVGNPSTKPEYTYEEATDLMAKLIYWIGKDLSINYGTSVSTGDSFSACVLTNFYNFSIPSFWIVYNELEMYNCLSQNNIIYVSGELKVDPLEPPTVYPGKGVVSRKSEIPRIGHAWVIDGYYYALNPVNQSEILDKYFHCNWGCNGDSDGYYNGSVFTVNTNEYETSGGKYEPQHWFSVQREWTNYFE